MKLMELYKKEKVKTISRGYIKRYKICFKRMERG